MAINILENPDKNTRPDKAIRMDVAWKLFLPEFMGDIPAKTPTALVEISGWLWNQLSIRCGSLMKDNQDVWIITPELTEGGRKFVIRIASFWSGEVYVISEQQFKEYRKFQTGDKNAWIPPVMNAYPDLREHDDLERLCEKDSDSMTWPLSPLLGFGHAYMRVYEIEPGKTFARLHSHSGVEEHYLVLDGEGTLRNGEHETRIVKGDLISKPTGPDMSSQLLSRADGKLLILDIEIWPDRNRRTKDVVIYPDHREILLRGEGWSNLIPMDAVLDASDMDRNYSTGYERTLDGGHNAKKIPGFEPRV